MPGPWEEAWTMVDARWGWGAHPRSEFLRGHSAVRGPWTSPPPSLGV